MLAWEYGKYSERLGGKVQGFAVMITSVEEFIEFISQ